jgi:hypothetical protein
MLHLRDIIEFLDYIKPNCFLIFPEFLKVHVHNV